MSAIRVNSKGEPTLSEADVAIQIIDFLRWQGFQAIRTDVVRVPSARGFVRAGEIGQSDYIFVRPVTPGRVDFFYAELKAADAKTDAKRAAKQAAFAEDRTQQGYLCYRAPDDGMDKLEHFKEWFGCQQWDKE